MDHEEIDILTLHNNLIKTFKEDKEKLEIYQKKKDDLQKVLDKNISTTSMQKKIINEINGLKKLIDEINSENLLQFYEMESNIILKEYEKTLYKPVIVDFMKKTKNVENNNSKIKLIEQYLKIYNKYNSKNFLEHKNNYCPNCKSDNSIINDNNIICQDCGNCTLILAQNSSYKDSERINIIPRYTYDRKSHFRDCINQFQGKQVVNIQQLVYDDLIYQFELNHLLVGDKSTPKHERFKKISKKHILMFLKETQHAKHYEDINYIYQNLTGKTINDISHIERQILEDFDILTDAYDKLYKNNVEITRKSFINSQYVLYQLLKKYNYDCDKEDFNILKTSDRQNFHDEICKELFKYLGWNFKCIF